jgi:hypothetical protein
MSASVPFSVVDNMIKECAPGCTWRLSTHNRVFTFDALTYRTFPKHDNVELGHVRKMVRHLKIDKACATGHIPGLFKPE